MRLDGMHEKVTNETVDNLGSDFSFGKTDLESVKIVT